MKSFLKAVWRLRVKRSNRIVPKANACHLSDVEVCLCDKSLSKPQQYSPEKGWRLLAHIGYTGTIARIDQTHDIELDEDILERIDFLACLFAGRRINK
jgi:hypothetical protein